MEPLEIVSPPQVDPLSFIEVVYQKIMAFFPAVFAGGQAIFGWVVGISMVVSFFFLIGIIYCVEQLKLIRKKEELIYDTKVEPAYQESNGDTTLARRWESISTHINSDNPNDWKQAIIDCDMILDQILTEMGYRGESVGEKLKRVVPGDMKSLDAAWEAHKVRNQIAHEPGFAITHHDAKHTVNKYRSVFEEFYYI